MNKTQIREQYEERLNEMYNQVNHYKECLEITEELHDIQIIINAKLREEIKELKSRLQGVIK